MAGVHALRVQQCVTSGALAAPEFVKGPADNGCRSSSQNRLWGLGESLSLPSITIRKTGVARRSLHVSAARKGQLATAKPSSGKSKSGAPPAEEDKRPVIERTDDAMAEREYRPAMAGDQPGLLEGPAWNWLGFFLQYLWAFGIVVAIVASLYAVRTYNEGASDIKDTELFKLQEGGPIIGPEGLDNSLLDDAPPL